MVVLAAFTAAPVQADDTLLSQGQIAQAIELGNQAKDGRDLGVEIKIGRSQGLKSIGANLGGRLKSGIKDEIHPNEIATRFKGRLFTPQAWIAREAVANKKAGAPMQPSDVAPEFRRSVVRLVIEEERYLPYIKRIVLRRDGSDEKGVSGTCAESICEFPLEQVKHLFNDEFVITVLIDTGEQQVENFKVGRDKLNLLPL